MTGEWLEVWECPRCLTQFAVADTGVGGFGAPPVCSSLGHEHEPVECEQKMVEAFPLSVEEMFGEGEE